eukprot:2917245-Amphidinium_carterae.2
MKWTGAVDAQPMSSPCQMPKSVWPSHHPQCTPLWTTHDIAFTTNAGFCMPWAAMAILSEAKLKKKQCARESKVVGSLVHTHVIITTRGKSKTCMPASHSASQL